MGTDYGGRGWGRKEGFAWFAQQYLRCMKRRCRNNLASILLLRSESRTSLATWHCKCNINIYYGSENDVRSIDRVESLKLERERMGMRSAVCRRGGGGGGDADVEGGQGGHVADPGAQEGAESRQQPQRPNAAAQVRNHAAAGQRGGSRRSEFRAEG